MHDNPFAEFVDLPPELASSLWYSNLLCGAVTGSLQAIHLEVACDFVSDELRGDDRTVIQLEFKGVIKEHSDEDE